MLLKSRGFIATLLAAVMFAILLMPTLTLAAPSVPTVRIARVDSYSVTLGVDPASDTSGHFTVIVTISSPNTTTGTQEFSYDFWRYPYITINNLRPDEIYTFDVRIRDYTGTSGSAVVTGKTDYGVWNVPGYNPYTPYDPHYPYNYAYNVIDQTTTHSGGNAYFLINAPFNAFSGVSIDGSRLNSYDYYIESDGYGRTRVTVYADYLNKLYDTTHGASFYFADGTAHTSFSTNSYSYIPPYTPPSFSVGYYKVILSALDVHQYGFGSARIIATLRYGELLNIISVSNGWGSFTLPNGLTGWAPMTALASSSAPTVVAPAVPGTLSLYTTANLHMRSGPGIGFLSTGILPKGSPVTPIRYDGSWAYALVNGQYVYLHSAYLR